MQIQVQCKSFEKLSKRRLGRPGTLEPPADTIWALPFLRILRGADFMATLLLGSIKIVFNAAELLDTKGNKKACLFAAYITLEIGSSSDT